MKILLLTLSFFSIQFAHADNIEIRADSWCPYNCEPTDKNLGFMIEIAQEALKPHGHKINYSLMPWSRALKEASDGGINGVVGAAKEDAPDLVFPEEALGESANCFFGDAASTWKYEGIKSLESQNLGAIKDYSYAEDLDKYINDNAKNLSRISLISGETALKQNVEKLKLKRLSLIVEDANVLADYLKANKLDTQIKNLGCLETKRNVFIAFSPKNPKSKEYAEQLSKGIQELRKSGALKSILDKYGAKDWK